MKRSFLPVFSVDCFSLLKKVTQVEGNYGILVPFSCSNNFLATIPQTGKPFFIDSGVFEKTNPPWYYQMNCELVNKRWTRELRLANTKILRQKIKSFLDRCDQFKPDYVFAPDIIGEPLLSLYLAQLTLEEYHSQPRSYSLIGVVQVGSVLYNWQQDIIPQKEICLPHYNSPKSFLASLISKYRELGYQYIALGGLLKTAQSTPTGLKFGMSAQELDNLLFWSRPDFVLGGLALSRIEVLKKHKVWADSTNWLWWDARYDPQRFGGRNALQEILE